MYSVNAGSALYKILYQAVDTGSAVYKILYQAVDKILYTALPAFTAWYKILYTALHFITYPDVVYKVAAILIQTRGVQSMVSLEIID